MKVRIGTTLPPVSRQPYALAAKSTRNSKKQPPSGRRVSSQTSICASLNAYEITFCFIQMSCQQKNKPGMSNGFSNMALSMFSSEKIGYSNTIIFQVMVYDNVVYKLLHPLSF